jgi:hypothetical protein
MDLFSDKDKMPKNGSLTVVQVQKDKSFLDYMPARFTKIGTCAPCGTGPDGGVLWQRNVTDPETDETFTITEEDFVQDEVRVRRLVFLYYS